MCYFVANNRKNKVGTEVVLTYSEKTSQTQLTFDHLPNVDKNLLERKDTELAAAIIRNSSKSVEIEETRIVVEVL